MCRYNYGGKYCAHRMIDERECVGEHNCLERAAPSYHSRHPRCGPVHPAKRAEQSPLTAFSRSIDLHLIDLGTPLLPERL